MIISLTECDTEDANGKPRGGRDESPKRNVAQHIRETRGKDPKMRRDKMLTNISRWVKLAGYMKLVYVNAKIWEAELKTK